MEQNAHLKTCLSDIFSLFFNCSIDFAVASCIVTRIVQCKKSAYFDYLKIILKFHEIMSLLNTHLKVWDIFETLCIHKSKGNNFSVKESKFVIQPTWTCTILSQFFTPFRDVFWVRRSSSSLILDSDLIWEYRYRLNRDLCRLTVNLSRLMFDSGFCCCRT